jgi:HAE1 family hydrophobic/amphiphilic exporter-1
LGRQPGHPPSDTVLWQGFQGQAFSRTEAVSLDGARVRLRTIIMTSFAFILGRVPLWTASGSGAVARRIMGTTVIGGMLAATLIAIFLISVTYYVVERFADRRGERAAQDAVRAGTN